MLPAVTIRLWGVAATLLIGTALLVAGFVALAATHTLPVYYLGATLMGVGYCFCGTVPSVHIISSMFERRSTALGVYFTSGNIGAVGGPILFYTVSEVLHGWRAYWLICAGASAAAGIVAAIMTRGRTAQAEGAEGPDAAPVAADEPSWTVREALAGPQYWIIVGAYTACLLVNTTMHSFAFQHMMEHGQTKAGATAYMSLAALVAAGAAGIAGVVGEKLEARRLTMLSLAALTVTGLSLAMPDQTGAFTLFAVSVGIGLGFSWVSTAMLLQHYFGRRANLELYSIMTAISTSAAIGPGLGGIVRDHTGNFNAVFAGLAVIVAVFLVAVALMRRPAVHAQDDGLPAPLSEREAAVV